MPDLNAGLLQIGDLSNQIQQGRQIAQQENRNLIGSIGSLAGVASSALDQNALNKALSKNFDPVTGKVNQQGVIADMYAYNPQKGQALAQQYQQQDFARQKMQSELNKTNAETGKLGAEAGKIKTESSGLDLKQQLDKNQLLHKLILSIDPNNPSSTQKALQYAKSIGVDTSLFDGIDSNNPKSVINAKRQASGFLIEANDQIKNQIDQQNAISTRMNAETNQRVAGQNYELGTNRNNIDMYGKNIEDRKVSNEIAMKGMITPQQQIQNSLEISKANNELEKEKITQVNKIQTGINNLSKANKVIDLFTENASKILKSELVTGGLDPKTGDVLRDSTGRVVPNETNNLGGVLGSLRTNDTLLNPLNKGSNDYKKLQAEYERLALQARGKGLSDLKSLSATGSAGLGGVSDMEGKMLGVMQNVPDWEGFRKMNPQERVDLLDGIIKAGVEDKINNSSLIERGKSQADVFSKQNINIVTPNKVYNERNNNLPLSLPTSLPLGLPNDSQTNSNRVLPKEIFFKPEKPYTDPTTGYVLMPKMAEKIARMKSRQE